MLDRREKMQTEEKFRACSDCGSSHLNAPCGMTFRERLLSVRLGEGTTDTRTKHAMYDDDAIADQFGGKRAPERREELFEETKGLGAGQRGKDGKLYVRDPKTKEQRRMTPKDVKDVYLGGPIVDET